MDPVKHLWEYKHKELFEVELNHKAKDRFKSWSEFIADPNKALSCDCVVYSPLLYWYWDSPENRAYSYGYDSDSEDPNGSTDILSLIYGMWSSGITRFEIEVDRSDEPKIRDWIRQHQNKISV